MPSAAVPGGVPAEGAGPTQPRDLLSCWGQHTALGALPLLWPRLQLPGRGCEGTFLREKAGDFSPATSLRDAEQEPHPCSIPLSAGAKTEASSHPKAAACSPSPGSGGCPGARQGLRGTAGVSPSGPGWPWPRGRDRLHREPAKGARLGPLPRAGLPESFAQRLRESEE